jgi:hypothetical protein
MVTVKGGVALERRLGEIAAKLGGGPTLSVGFMEGATYPDGTSVAMVAATQEFGAPARNIPPRPFFRQTIAEHSPAWGGAIAKLLAANNYDVNLTLQMTGESIKGQIQDTIASFSSVPLSPKTIKAKGFDKQLIETDNMINSVDWTVDRGIRCWRPIMLG